MESQNYHPGELAAQEKAGELSIAQRNGRMVTNQIMPGAINFIQNQNFFLISTKDTNGSIWVSLVTGATGMVQVVDASTLNFYPECMHIHQKDIVWENLKINQKAGILFIELSTRRRFRVNGTLQPEKNKFTLLVDQAYPNCPKYIQKRQVILQAVPEPASKTGTVLDNELIDLIKSADTLFVGSSNNVGEMDASHRGGFPGFIQVLNATTLKIPDYAGNSMFNTLGNFLVQPHAGITIVDFKHHQTLQLTGTAQITWHDEEANQETGGTNRYWTFTLEKYILLGQNLSGQLIDYSPFNPG